MCSGDATMHCTDNPQRGDGSDAGGFLLSVDRCACGFRCLALCGRRPAACAPICDSFSITRPTFFFVLVLSGVAEAL